MKSYQCLKKSRLKWCLLRNMLKTSKAFCPRTSWWRWTEQGLRPATHWLRDKCLPPSPTLQSVSSLLKCREVLLLPRFFSDTFCFSKTLALFSALKNNLHHPSHHLCKLYLALQNTSNLVFVLTMCENRGCVSLPSQTAAGSKI